MWVVLPPDCSDRTRPRPSKPRVVVTPSAPVAVEASPARSYVVVAVVVFAAMEPAAAVMSVSVVARLRASRVVMVLLTAALTHAATLEAAGAQEARCV